MDIIFVGALIVVIGGFITAYGTLRQNRASSLKSEKQLEKISDLNDQNSALLDTLTGIASQNNSLVDNVAQLSSQNIGLIDELSNARKDVEYARKESFQNTLGSMGGIVVLGSNNLKLFNRSKLPMYDVSIIITEYEKLLKCDKIIDPEGKITINKTCYESTNHRFTIPIIYGEDVADILQPLYTSKNTFRLEVTIFTRAGTYRQQLTQSPTLGTAFRLIREIDKGKFHEQFSKGTPLILKPQKFEIYHEENLRDNPVDWDKEFPLPLAFDLDYNK